MAEKGRADLPPSPLEQNQLQRKQKRQEHQIPENRNLHPQQPLSKPLKSPKTNGVEEAIDEKVHPNLPTDTVAPRQIIDVVALPLQIDQQMPGRYVNGVYVVETSLGHQPI